MSPYLRNSAGIGIAAITILATATASFARPDARTMTCHQTQSLIERSGAIVLSTGQHTYERFVGSSGYCDTPTVPAITYISTKDTRQCPVHNCQTPIRPFDD